MRLTHSVTWKVLLRRRVTRAGWDTEAKEAVANRCPIFSLADNVTTARPSFGSGTKDDFQDQNFLYLASSSNRALACFKSSVSKPSVNQP